LQSRSALLQSLAHFALLQLVRQSPASTVHCCLHLLLLSLVVWPNTSDGDVRT
jgi:hypothetical protein